MASVPSHPCVCVRVRAPSTQSLWQVSAADVNTCRRYYADRQCGPISGFAAQLDEDVFGRNLNISGASASINPESRSLQFRRSPANATAGRPPVLGVLITPAIGPSEVVQVKFVIPKFPTPPPPPAAPDAPARRRLLLGGGRQLLQSAADPSGLHPTIAWGPSFFGSKVLGLDDPIFNLTILGDASFFSRQNVTNRDLAASPLQLLASLGTTSNGAQDATQLLLSLADSSAPDTPANPKQPVYLRFFPAQQARRGIAAQPQAAADAVDNGVDITFTAAPTPESTFNYSLALPSGTSFFNGIDTVCAQGVTPAQPNQTCLLQVITSNDTVYSTYLTPAQLGLVAGSNPLFNFTGLITNPGQTQYPAARTNWLAQMYNATENATHVSFAVLAALSDLATCNSAGLGGCSTVTGVALLLNDTALPGVDTGATTVTNPEWLLAGVPAPTFQVRRDGLARLQRPAAAGGAAVQLQLWGEAQP